MAISYLLTTDTTKRHMSLHTASGLPPYFVTLYDDFNLTNLYFTFLRFQMFYIPYFIFSSASVTNFFGTNEIDIMLSKTTLLKLCGSRWI